jgi:hypothetical protein
VNATTHTGTTVSVTGNITGGNVLGGANVNATTHTGTTVSVTGNIDGGNLRTVGLISATSTVTGSQFNGSGAGLTSIPGANVTGTVPLATSATTAGTVTTAAQGNITSVGTLTSLTVSGALSSGAHTITGSPATAIVNGGTTGTGNIGATGAVFNTLFATATTALYADLAEMYASDAKYEPGTVVDFGGTQEITISATAASDRIAGVVSTDPAHLMNSTQQGEHVIAVALTGRVPTRVTGTVWKGAMMISAGNGHAQACATPSIGTVIGKSLEDFSGDSGMIHVVVGRL